MDDDDFDVTEEPVFGVSEEGDLVRMDEPTKILTPEERNRMYTQVRQRIIDELTSVRNRIAESPADAPYALSGSVSPRELIAQSGVALVDENDPLCGAQHLWESLQERLQIEDVDTAQAVHDIDWRVNTMLDAAPDSVNAHAAA